MLFFLTSRSGYWLSIPLTTKNNKNINFLKFTLLILPVLFGSLFWSKTSFYVNNIYLLDKQHVDKILLWKKKSLSDMEV